MYSVCIQKRLGTRLLYSRSSKSVYYADIVNDNYNLHSTLMTPMSVKPPQLRHWNANPLSIRETFRNSNVKGSITLKLGGRVVPNVELPGGQTLRVVNDLHLNVTLSSLITSIVTSGAASGTRSTETFSVIWPVRLIRDNKKYCNLSKIGSSPFFMCCFPHQT